MITYLVLETAMFPNCWFGGPTFNGLILDNSPCYYFPSIELAQQNVNRLASLKATNVS